MRLPNEETVKMLRGRYPVGMRVELVNMDDPQAPPIGTKGSVIWVDDIGTVHVKWDTGSTIGAAFLVDTIRVVEEG